MRNNSDGYVYQKLETLNEIIETHKNLIFSGYEPISFIPDELFNDLDEKQIESFWESQDYDSIRLAFVESWINFISHLEATTATAKDFIDNKVF